MKFLTSGLILLASMVAFTPASAKDIPARFESHGDDLKAINKLLATYTKAVSTKDQALFETLLLDRSIPFSSAPPSGGTTETRNYEAFRAAVFEGEPFTQRFRDVHIEQDGDLANVRLVFEDSSANGRSWGWKTLQLLKVGGAWKIASEFFTGHAEK